MDKRVNVGPPSIGYFLKVQVISNDSIISLAKHIFWMYVFPTDGSTGDKSKPFMRCYTKGMGGGVRNLYAGLIPEKDLLLLLHILSS